MLVLRNSRGFHGSVGRAGRTGRRRERASCAAVATKEQRVVARGTLSGRRPRRLKARLPGIGVRHGVLPPMQGCSRAQCHLNSCARKPVRTRLDLGMCCLVEERRPSHLGCICGIFLLVGAERPEAPGARGDLLSGLVLIQLTVQMDDRGVCQRPRAGIARAGRNLRPYWTRKRRDAFRSAAA